MFSFTTRLHHVVTLNFALAVIPTRHPKNTNLQRAPAHSKSSKNRDKRSFSCSASCLLPAKWVLKSCHICRLSRVHAFHRPCCEVHLKGAIPSIPSLHALCCATRGACILGWEAGIEHSVLLSGCGRSWEIMSSSSQASRAIPASP